MLLIVPKKNKNQIVNQNIDLLVNAAKASKNWEVIRLSKDFSKLKNSDIKLNVPYGDKYFCEKLYKENICQINTVSFNWITKLPRKYLQRSVNQMTVKDARNIPIELFLEFEDSSIPNLECKNGSEIPSQVNDELNVLASDPIEWDSKYRCFIRNGTVTTSCCYFMNNKFNDPANYKKVDLAYDFYNPAAFVDTISDNVKMPTSIVMDVGIIKNKGWAVISTPSIYDCDIFGCDPDMVLKTLEISNILNA